jgi:hypothetical protein
MLVDLVRWIFRPIVLIAVSVALVGTAAVIVFRSESGPLQPQRPPLRPGDQEIAWIYPATSTGSWERFVAAVRRTRKRLQVDYPGLEVQDRSAPAAGSGSTGVPEIVLARPGGRRLVFRWYKLTSDWSPEAWVKELLARRPYPLAIIGGNTSLWARELAIHLQLAGADLPEAQRPLLILTTATADRVSRPEWMPATPPRPGAAPDEEAKQVELAEIYPERTYRFCFTNRQMATAVTQFLWRRADLRPDADQAYLVQWTDDPYSKDLCIGYWRVLDRRVVDTMLQQWAFVSGCVGQGLPAPALAGWLTTGFRHEGPYTLRIPSGVGGFDLPNTYEQRDVEFLLGAFPKEEKTLLVPLKAVPGQSGGSAREGDDRTKIVPLRLLVVTGQAGPSRRFLRELDRAAPDLVRRFVVATGDSISFNTIYRDRIVTWPIQDLPFTLALFSHRNPIDEKAGFRPLSRKEGQRNDVVAASGTEDLLLYGDIVEAIVQAGASPVKGIRDAATLAGGLDALHLDGDRLVHQPRGRPLFSPRSKGMRNSFTGEHVVCLRPHFEGRRVQGEATIEVWARLPGADPEHPEWKSAGLLPVSYNESRVPRERPHGD